MVTPCGFLRNVHSLAGGVSFLLTRWIPAPAPIAIRWLVLRDPLARLPQRAERASVEYTLDQRNLLG